MQAIPRLIRRFMLGRGQDKAPYIDLRWYMQKHSRYCVADLSVFEHYNRYGWKERRDPNPFFDIDFYLKNSPDVARQQIDPLAHYIKRGWREGRAPNLLFDPHWYLATNRDVADAGVEPLLHFIKNGSHEFRNPHPLFDARWYHSQNPDSTQMGVTPLEHYLETGRKNKRSPHPLFDARWYIEQYENVMSCDDPLIDYLCKGFIAGRDPNPLFSSSWYATQNPSLGDLSINPLVHYIWIGQYEGRNPHPEFDANWYVSNYADINAIGMNPLQHYLHHGRFEGRQYRPIGEEGRRVYTSYEQAGSQHLLPPNSQIENVLLITHDWGGGTQRFIQSKISILTNNGIGVYLLRKITPDGEVLVEALDARGRVSRVVKLDPKKATLPFELKKLQITRSEVHSLIVFPSSSWKPLLHSLTVSDIPYEVYIHDYMFICPRIFMVLPGGEYCGEPDIHGCDRCIARHGALIAGPPVANWRKMYGQMLGGASRIVAPDRDVRTRFQSHFPGISIEVCPHPTWHEDRIRVVVLGHCQVHKGSDTLVQTARTAFARSSPIQFILLGTSDREDDLRHLANVKILGPYRDADLKDRLIEIGADFVWFPGQAVETFSYTLSTALELGLKTVAFDIGAIASRMRACGNGQILPLKMARDYDALVDQFLITDKPSQKHQV